MAAKMKAIQLKTLYENFNSWMCHIVNLLEWITVYIDHMLLFGCDTLVVDDKLYTDFCKSVERPE